MEILVAKREEITEMENTIKDEYKSLCDQKKEFDNKQEEEKKEFNNNQEEEKKEFNNKQEEEKKEFNNKQEEEKKEFNEELEPTKNNINEKIKIYNVTIADFNQEQISLDKKILEENVS
jgi:hypothetical protein